MWTPEGLISDSVMAATADEEQQAGALSDAALAALGAQSNRIMSTTRTLAVQTTRRVTLLKGSISTTPRFYYYNGRYWRLPQEWYLARRATAYAFPLAITVTTPRITTTTASEDIYEEAAGEENNEAE